MSLFQRFLCLLLGLLFFGYMSVLPSLAGDTPAVKISPDAGLMGLEAAQVATLLGPPSFKRAENGAHVWQYVRGGCVLNLFLFKKPPRPGLRVQYLDAAPQSQNPGEPVSPVERQRCLRLFTAPATPPAAK